MTEIGMALGNPLNGPRVPGSVGLPFPGVKARIVSDQNVDITQDQLSGELQISGPQIFKEYLIMKTQSAEVYV
jgi:malonyl-CoA/methylmalonyl-CoA synthetase